MKSAPQRPIFVSVNIKQKYICLLYTSDAADE